MRRTLTTLISAFGPLPKDGHREISSTTVVFCSPVPSFLLIKSVTEKNTFADSFAISLTHRKLPLATHSHTQQIIIAPCWPTAILQSACQIKKKQKLEALILWLSAPLAQNQCTPVTPRSKLTSQRAYENTLWLTTDRLYFIYCLIIYLFLIHISLGVLTNKILTE